MANAGIGGGPRRGSVDGFELNFADVMLEHGYDSMRAYCQSKLAQIALGLRLARTLRSSGVTVTSLHPASEMPTKMVGRRDGEPISLGVATTMRLATDPDLEGVTGVFFDRYRPSRPHPWAMDLDVQDQLWEHSAHLVAATGPR